MPRTGKSVTFSQIGHIIVGAPELNRTGGKEAALSEALLKGESFPVQTCTPKS